MKYLLFLGTVRDSTPPKPARLGLRVARACINHLQTFQSEHEVELIDPLDYDLSAPFKPHFSYAKGQAPKSLDELADKIASSDNTAVKYAKQAIKRGLDMPLSQGLMLERRLSLKTALLSGRQEAMDF